MSATILVEKRAAFGREPVMNAFAHLIGFYNDYQTVVHLHSSGGDILTPEARGGPSLGFQFFHPRQVSFAYIVRS
ncbi:MAG: hypothetical protein V4710_15955 [Verrucomicrobiota bacterium]